jgi:hypothetical protein
MMALTQAEKTQKRVLTHIQAALKAVHAAISASKGKK